jgi:3'-phosphoadenosine 5'-phosphosulfate sulfotransferase (PAPS reductase)/FAD synthetase
MGNPYLIQGPALISFSGGRTSAYMLKQILDAHGGTLPEDVHVTFANTGKEREETLRFVHECATRWGVTVRWLEFRSRKVSLPIDARFEEVGYNSASRSGEPFEALIRDKQYTPNAVMRWCTAELKVRVMKWFMQSLGYKNWINVVGLRHDEQHRVAKSRKPNKEAWTNALPLDDAKVSNRAVRAFWAAQDFDLQLLPFEGNCDGCFLKARPKLWEIERTCPGTLKWWSDMEGVAGGQFVTEYSYAELISDVRRQPDMFAGGLFDDDPEMDAECGTWCGEVA